MFHQYLVEMFLDILRNFHNLKISIKLVCVSRHVYAWRSRISLRTWGNGTYLRFCDTCEDDIWLKYSWLLLENVLLSVCLLISQWIKTEDFFLFRTYSPLNTWLHSVNSFELATFCLYAFCRLPKAPLIGISQCMGKNKYEFRRRKIHDQHIKGYITGTLYEEFKHETWRSISQQWFWKGKTGLRKPRLVLKSHNGFRKSRSHRFKVVRAHTQQRR